MTTSSRIKTASALLATCAAVGALAASTSAASGQKVAIKGDSEANYTFAPKTIHVGKGTRVRWSWDSNAPHNVTFRRLGEKSVTRSKAGYHLKFKQKGSYAYVCTVHGFKGKVVVGR